jgi:hypothetical protein
VSSGVSSHRRAVGGLAVLGIAMTLTACSSSGAPAGTSSTTHSGVVTTVPGGETCESRTGVNDASPDFYRQQYATGLAAQLKNKLGAYDSAVESGDSQRISDSAYALGDEIRVDARLVDVPRLFGCYDQRVLAGLESATEALETALDALSCSGVNACNRNPAEVPALAGRAKPQERSYVAAINAYAAQFGGEQLPLPRITAGFNMRV